jgi:hypothetical protein
VSETTSIDPEVAQNVRGFARSASFLGGFGGAWLLWGLMAAREATPLTLAAAGACCACILVAGAALRRSAPGPQTPGAARLRRGFLLVNLAQWAAIAAAVAALSWLGAIDALPVAISVIVALHFIPLARLFDAPAYYATCGAMLAIDAAALLSGDDRGVPAATFGTGVALWATAAIQLARGRRMLSRASGQPRTASQARRA